MYFKLNIFVSHGDRETEGREKHLQNKHYYDYEIIFMYMGNLLCVYCIVYHNNKIKRVNNKNSISIL